MQGEDKSLLAQFLRDPLFHFLIAGAVIYAGFALMSEPDPAAATTGKKLVVTQGEIEWLSAQWDAKWGRAPTEEEMQSLINAHVKEMVFYREALELGLDKEDVVIRRRLGQKLEFLSADLLEPEPPTEEQLRAYFEANIDAYRLDDRMTMTQVFFNPDERGDQTVEDAKAVLAELQAAPDAPRDLRGLGDRFLLPNYFAQVSQREVARQFGSGFADPVFQLEPRVWHGPVLSGYGTHLVYIHDFSAAPDPLFEDVSGQVASDWLNMKREELNKAFTDQLIGLYDVTIEQPDPIAVEGGEAVEG